MKRTFGLACLALVLTALPLSAQGTTKQVIVIFKDGFVVQGRVIQEKSFIVDPITGGAFSVPKDNSLLHIDDMVRRIHFTPSQIQEVILRKPEDFQDQEKILNIKGITKRGLPLLPGWRFESISDWNDKGQRTIKVDGADRSELIQRLTDITPTWTRGLTIGTDYDFSYLTQEFEPETMRKIVRKQFADRSDLKDHQRRLHVANFLRQAGWLKEAESELEQIQALFPAQEATVNEYLLQLHKQMADLQAEDVERLSKNGAHDAARDIIDALDQDANKAKLLSDKNRLLVQEKKTRYESLASQCKLAEKLLKDLPGRTSERKFWTGACKMILDELTIDTVARLETFANFAPPHLKELEDGRKPTQKTEEILALAVSGWLQGNSLAETDPKLAARLLHAREFVLSYLRNETAPARAEALASFQKQDNLPLDAMVRLIRLLPPTQPNTEKQETSGPTKMSIDVPDSVGGTYWLKLPPEYSPYRSYPVVLLLHSHREPAEPLVKRWEAEGAKHGFILAAPVWSKDKAPEYTYGKAQHDVVIDTLRDLRRRFNVDSDRVFLFGWEQGANAAFDIGLAHPDLFAGVAPMNGAVQMFASRYLTNGQYLPFYIVDGDRSGYFKNTRAMYREWMRGHYPAVYIEYKGRGSEWYGSELPSIADWMSRKKRYYPNKDLGRYHTGGLAGMGEEFKTMRQGDSRFYWLSADDIMPNRINEFYSWKKAIDAATLQANMAEGNEAGAKGSAQVWTQFTIRTSGITRVSLWLLATHDFTKPVLIRVNGTAVGGKRTIRPSLHTLLEDLYVTGDRQRLYAARIELRP